MARLYNCEKKGKPYYRVTKTVDGKRMEFYGKGKADAEKKRDAYLMEHEKQKKEKEQFYMLGYDPEYKDVILGEDLHAWLYGDKLRSVNKASTFERYENVYRKHILYCGSCRKCMLLESKIFDWTKTKARACVARMEQNPDKSENQIRWAIAILKMYFEHLIHIGVIPNNNPFLKLQNKKKKGAVKEIVPFSSEDKEKLEKALVEIDETFRVLFFLDFNSGLRQGELLGLKWEDLDWGKGVYIRRTLAYSKVFRSETDYKRQFILQEPKGNRARFVALPEYVWPVLKEHKRQQTEKLLAIGNLKFADFIFVNQNGNLIRGRRVLEVFKKAQKKAEIDERKFHAIRHTYISDLASDPSIPILIIQQQAGHSDLKITERYLHTREDAKMQAVKGFQAF